MRPTPETDALFWSNGYPVVVASSKAMQLCEKLEQERDWITEKFKLLEGCFKRAERERDEERESLRILADYAKNEIKRLRMICQHAHDRLLRGAPDNDLLLILEKSWKEKTK